MCLAKSFVQLDSRKSNLLVLGFATTAKPTADELKKAYKVGHIGMLLSCGADSVCLSDLVLGRMGNQGIQRLYECILLHAERSQRQNICSQRENPKSPNRQGFEEKGIELDIMSYIMYVTV